MHICLNPCLPLQGRMEGRCEFLRYGNKFSECLCIIDERENLSHCFDRKAIYTGRARGSYLSPPPPPWIPDSLYLSVCHSSCTNPSIHLSLSLSRSFLSQEVANLCPSLRDLSPSLFLRWEFIKKYFKRKKIQRKNTENTILTKKKRK